MKIQFATETNQLVKYKLPDWNFPE